jgi:hypothetical protein
LASRSRARSGAWTRRAHPRRSPPFPSAPGFLLGLATDAPGAVYAAAASFDPATHGVWRNGAALSGRSLLVANTRFGRIVRIPIEPDGTAGTPTTLIERDDLIGADGVALEVRRNLYVAMFGGPASRRLVRIAPEGRQEELAGQADGLTGPASLAFGAGRHTRRTLFITNFDLFFSHPEPGARAGRRRHPGPTPSLTVRRALRRRREKR